jgi:hypothetical protein
MPEMMDYQLWEQRREDLLREAELSRRSKALWATLKRRDSQSSILVWEMKRYAERLLKLLSTPADVPNPGLHGKEHRPDDYPTGCAR